MTELLLILSAPAKRLPDGRIRLDVKFLDGLKRHQDLWDDKVRCLLWETAGPIPFGQDLSLNELTVETEILPAGTQLRPDHLRNAGIILAAGDSWLTHDLPTIAGRQVPLVYAVEYTLKTRLDILRLRHDVGLLRKARSAWWLIRQEGRMRRAFRAARGLQCNGFPAFAAYRGLTPQSMVYLDGRIHSALLATPKEQAIRAQRLRAGEPLRLVNFGRLETMKGAQDFLPFAQALTARRIGFTLDIFGTGTLGDDIQAGIARAGLTGRVTLHAPVDFETELAPWMRRNADIFLSCHRQDDPSCAYIEAMGCGLAVLGYDNAMMSALAQESQAGRCVRLGDVAALAAEAERLAQDRTVTTTMTDRALAYAKEHDFEAEFALRMQHLRTVAQG